MVSKEREQGVNNCSNEQQSDKMSVKLLCIITPLSSIRGWANEMGECKDYYRSLECLSQLFSVLVYSTMIRNFL